ncbi:MAG: alpha/beta hydrolase [Granulosicoccus sp.]
MKISRLLVSALASVSLLAGCSSSDNDEDASSVVTDERVTTENYTVVDCGELIPSEIIDENILDTDRSTECGQVTVPADWEEPDGAMITLAVYRIPSTTDHPAVDPLIYLEGGPGGAGVGIVGEFSFGEAAYLRERSDIWVIDQRGTGYSKPALYCQEIFQAEAEETDMLAAHQACHDRLVGEGVDFADYNSAYNALDVDAVRVALGYEDWNLYGLSYGTRLALTVMRDKPEHVRSVILDSVFPIEVNGLSESFYPAYWTIEQIAINCAADDDCTDNVGNLQEVIEAGIARLDANPVGELTAGTYLEMLSSLIADPEVAAVAFLVANGSDDEVRELVSAMSDENEEAEVTANDVPPEFYPFIAETADAMYYAVVCGEEAAYQDNKAGPDIAADFNEATQRVITEFANSDSDYALCDSVYTVPPRGLVETLAVNSSLPALVLAGTADVATPPGWSLLADEALANSQYAEFAGLTHGLIGNNECLNQITLDFLNDPSEAADQSCILDLPRVDYVFD